MRKTRLASGLVGIAASLGLVVGLTGCASATPPLSLAQGIAICSPNPHALAEGFAIDARNSGGYAITILSARVGAANLKPGRSWLLPVDRGTVGVAAMSAPFTAIPDWAARRGLPADIPARTNAQVFVTMTFPDGIRSSQFTGVTVRYRAADGMTHTAKTDVKATFGSHCG